MPSYRMTNRYEGVFIAAVLGSTITKSYVRKWERCEEPAGHGVKLVNHAQARSAARGRDPQRRAPPLIPNPRGTLQPLTFGRSERLLAA